MATRKLDPRRITTEGQWRELVLAYARQLDELGVSAIDILNRSILAEHQLREAERRMGRPASRPEDLAKIVRNAPLAFRSATVLLELERLRAPFFVQGRHRLTSEKGRDHGDGKRKREALRALATAIMEPRMLRPQRPGRPVGRALPELLHLRTSLRMDRLRAEFGKVLPPDRVEELRFARLKAAGYSNLESLNAAIANRRRSSNRSA